MLKFVYYISIIGENFLMELNHTNNNFIKIDDDDLTFEKIYSKEYITDDILEDVKKANILLVPDKKYSEEPVFPERTTEFLDYLKDNAPVNNCVVDICISDEQYKRLELHDATVILPVILVQYVYYPIIINLISSYLYDLMKKTDNDNTKLKTEIIIEKDGESRKIKYDGPAEYFEKSLKAIKKNLLW